MCASTDEATPEFSSRYCDERRLVPSPNEDFRAYRDALLEISSREDVSTVIPCREEDAYLLSKYRAEFEEHVSLVVPSLETLTTVHDRVQLFEAADEVGVPIPETRRLDDVSEWDDPRLIKSR